MKALRGDGVKDLFVLPADKERLPAASLSDACRCNRLNECFFAYHGICCFLIRHLANAPMKGELSIK